MLFTFTIMKFIFINSKTKGKLIFIFFLVQFKLIGQGLPPENMPQSMKLTSQGVELFPNSKNCIDDIEPYLLTLKTKQALKHFNKAMNAINFRGKFLFGGFAFGSAALGTIGQSGNRGELWGGAAVLGITSGLISHVIYKYHINKCIKIYNTEMRRNSINR